MTAEIMTPQRRAATSDPSSRYGVALIAVTFEKYGVGRANIGDVAWHYSHADNDHMAYRG